MTGSSPPRWDRDRISGSQRNLVPCRFVKQTRSVAMPSLQPDDVRTPPVYRARRGLEIPCEHRILSELVQSDMMVLDVGCGATGRSTRQLSVFGPHVCACDVDLRALRRFQFWLQGEERIDLVGADMLRFPFRDESFDLTLVALCGLDYLWPDSRRIAALREIGRVVRPGGHFVLCSHNRLGVLTSPRGLRNRGYLSWRLRNICRLSFLRRQSSTSAEWSCTRTFPET